MEEMIKILFGGTLKAAQLIAGSRGAGVAEADLGDLIEAVKAALKANLDEIMGEWKDAVAARVGNAWLKEMLNLQCNEQALKALTLLEETCPTA